MYDRIHGMKTKKRFVHLESSRRLGTSTDLMPFEVYLWSLQDRGLLPEEPTAEEVSTAIRGMWTGQTDKGSYHFCGTWVPSLMECTLCHPDSKHNATDWSTVPIETIDQTTGEWVIVERTEFDAHPERYGRGRQEKA